MVHEVSFIKSLNLSLNLHDHNHDQVQDQDRQRLGTKSLIKLDQSLPSLTLGLGRDQDLINLINQQQASNSNTSLVSSFSNSTTTKRERDGGCEEVEKVFPKEISDMDQDDLEGGARKKLRLTKNQSFVLEENFKQHSTLIPKQKQTLAKSLNLRPRQVKVWFQNRRARTKLKQNEVECALLKKCCEALKSDNKRLKKEIQQLKALRTTTLPPHFYMQFPAATTHTMCPSCERTNFGNGGDVAKPPFSRAQKSHSHLFSQFC